ncbi:MAG: hypothetical protein AMXMBFR84_14790 [Candidatus Hydrogenedentota bacterium]
MKHFAFLLAGLMVASFGSGCNTLGRQPQMSEAAIVPAALKPGESAVISAKITDKQRIVDRVVAIVKEDTRMKLMLKDDGLAPDAKAGDGVWTVEVEVPFMAAPGKYTLEITAFNREGGVINVKQADKSEGPLVAVTELVINYPPEQ